jgi:hypothetical protein
LTGEGFLSAVNDELRRRAGTTAVFVCECGAKGCAATVELTPAAFDATRAAGDLVIAVGHAGPKPAGDVTHIRSALRARAHGAWERLEDAVAELKDLHGVPTEAILHRVRTADATAD